MLTSFMDLAKNRTPNVSPLTELLLVGLPMVAGGAALAVTLLADVLVEPVTTPEAQVANLTSQNHLLVAMVWVTSISVILLAVHNRRTMNRPLAVSAPYLPKRSEE